MLGCSVWAQRPAAVLTYPASLGALRIRSRTAAGAAGVLRVLTWGLSSPETTPRTQWAVFPTVRVRELRKRSRLLLPARRAGR